MAKTPSQVQNFYGFSTTNPGLGQKIAIVNLGAKPSNFSSLSDNIGLKADPSNSNTTNTFKWKDVMTTGYTSIPSDQLSTVDEVLADMAIIGSLCPYADITIYRAPCIGDAKTFLTAMVAIINQAVADGCTVISTSWGNHEAAFTGSELASDLSDFNSAVTNAVAKNVTICAATGDFGAADVEGGSTAQVDFPASNPNILAVGGTKLVPNSVTGEYTDEVVWPNTGGGVSTIYTKIPSYQSVTGSSSSSTGFPSISSANSGGGTGRIVPDVAALAQVWDLSSLIGSNYSSVQGTSCCAPFWASIIAMGNQGYGASLGCINSKLYSYAMDTSNTSIFNDITQGSNNCDPVNTLASYYSAQTGFDACTGWGSPNSGILTALATGLVSAEVAS